MEKPKRQSNLELLRIVSMLLIILHHFYVHGNIIFESSTITIKELIIQWLSMGGKIGVNLFVITTGYFMINSNFKIKKLLKIIGEVFFYSIGMFLICEFVLKMDLRLKDSLMSLFPIIYNNYGFMTSYVLVYIFSNYINKFVKSMNQKENSILLVLLIIIFSILPSMIFAKFQYSYFGWLIIMYLIGAYFRLYIGKIKSLSNKTRVVFIIVLLLLSLISIYVLDKLYIVLKIDPLYYALPFHQIIPLSISILTFRLFCDLKIKNSQFINKIASCTLGIYLIHDNRFFRSTMWTKFVKTSTIAKYPLALLWEIVSVITIFMIGCIIDLIRQYTFEKGYMKLIDKIEGKLKNMKENRRNKNYEI